MLKLEKIYASQIQAKNREPTMAAGPCCTFSVPGKAFSNEGKAYGVSRLSLGPLWISLDMDISYIER